MATFVIRAKRRVVEHVDIIVEADSPAEAVADATEQYENGHLNEWEYLTSPDVVFSIRGATLAELGVLSPEALTFLHDNGVTSLEHLLELGFDATCDLPDANRSVVKGIFAGLEEHLCV